MSTRGLIAIEDSDKTCRSIYVKFDMYILGEGITLCKHYATKERAEALLALGSLVGLGDKLSIDDPEPNADDVCETYHRDLHEKYQPPMKWENAQKMLNRAAGFCCAEYVYLFRNGEWYVEKPYSHIGWKKVKDILEVQDYGK